MRRWNGLAVALGFAVFATTALGQITLNLVVREAASDSSTLNNVTPGATIDYEVIGTLNPATGHLGLALFGFNLVYSGGDLQQGNSPAGWSANTPPDLTCGTAIANFKKPWGITNPAGLEGTIINGDLVQVGGGMNTIKNVDSAEFPVGPVKTGVAQPMPQGCGPATLLTGSFVAPQAEGMYTLSATEMFFNVIAPNQNGTEEFYATLAGTPGTSTPLTINVVSAVVDKVLVSSDPAVNTRLSRLQKNRIKLTFNENLPGAPGAGEVTIRKLLVGGLFDPNVAGSFNFTVNGADLIIDDPAGTLANKTWYAVQSIGTWPGVANFDFDLLTQFGDANNDGQTNFADLGTVNASIPTLPAGINDTNRRRDINGDNQINFADLGAANSFIPGLAVPKPGGH